MKKGVIVIALAVLLMLPLASAGFFDWLTGKATEPTNVTVEITSNNAPVIILVNVTSGSDLPNPEGSAPLIVDVNFSVYDLDGVSDILEDSGVVNITMSGVQRLNSSCVNISNDDSNRIMNFNCTVKMFYFDVPGNWQVEVSVQDESNTVADNTSQGFDLGTLTSVSITPNELTWSELTAGLFDQTEGPTILNNTGNDNFALVTLNATDLVKLGGSDVLGISNFTVNASTTAIGGCNATQLEKDVNVTITDDAGGLDLLRGNYTGDGEGSDEIYYCLDVPSVLASGNYTTNQSPSRAWEIEFVA